LLLSRSSSSSSSSSSNDVGSALASLLNTLFFIISLS
jgi:hypothetical protein